MLSVGPPAIVTAVENRWFGQLVEMVQRTDCLSVLGRSGGASVTGFVPTHRHRRVNHLVERTRERERERERERHRDITMNHRTYPQVLQREFTHDHPREREREREREKERERERHRDSTMSHRAHPQVLQRGLTHDHPRERERERERERDIGTVR
jgi:hypothetical protein